MFSFRSMNTEVLVAAPSLSDAEQETLAGRIANIFAASERMCSRFRADSELSVLNRATGLVRVSAELFEILARAREYTAQTRGLFDPAVGGTLCALGYDRSFSPGELDRVAVAPPHAHRSMLDVVLDADTCSVYRPHDVHIDLGGFVKGRTVDRAAALLPDTGFVDAGGDAMLRGAGPDGRGWLVDVEDPHDEGRSLLTLRIRDRAVATSAPNRRHWRAGRARAHHLIDPRVRGPAASDLAQVTIAAPSAELADVLAKTAFLRGARGAAELIAHTPGIGGVLVSHAGVAHVVGDLEVLDA